MYANFDLKTLLHNLQRYQMGLEQAYSDGLQEAAQKGAEVARSHLNHGPLQQNTVAYKASAFDQGIIANTHYASWVEYGNAPPGTRIYPTKSSCLHFFVGGREVFTKWVRASKPKPFMSYAMAFEQQNLSEIVAKHIHNFLKG